MTKARIIYARVDEFWRKGEKYAYLEERQHVGNVEWRELQPDAKHTWITEGLEASFDKFLPLGTKETKQAQKGKAEVVFKTYSLGVGTNRDEWVYDFNMDELEQKVRLLISNYNFELARYSQGSGQSDIDEFVNANPNFIKWTDRLKEALRQHKKLTFDHTQIRHSLYRPFTRKFLYFDNLLNQRRYQQHIIFSSAAPEVKNQLICVGGYGRKDFAVLVSEFIPDLNFYADPQQSFPFYTYNEDGTNRRENITDWALEKFREQYGDRSITKWDIFHYVYALLHHPVYRERYAANLKRELPRIPFAPDFRAFADAGARLAEIHVHYEQQPEHPLEKIEQKGAALSWRVEKMRLGKEKRELVYNEFLTLARIPQEAFEYRLGNRSALEWVIDQYQVSTDRRSGITNDPNRADDPTYIVRLVGQVIAVSLETVKLVRSLPGLGI